MKKIISLLLSFMLLFSMTSVVFADGESDTLSAIGILPSFSGGSSSNVTRAEFAFMVSKLVGAEHAPTATRFSDVGADNIYSGYVENLASMGVISGIGEGKFGPDGVVTYAQAAKMISNILGYDSYGVALGGYPNGYTELLSQLGLNKGVILAWDKVLTVDEAVKLIHNALTNELNSVSYMEKDGTVSSWMTTDKKEALLASRFEISVYEGTVNSTNDKGTSVNVTISKNKYDANPVKLAAGANVDFELADNITGDSYLYAPVVMWVDKNEKVIKITPQKNVEIKYVQIAKINGTNANFPISNINTIMFLDDETEYDVAEDARLSYNGNLTTGSAYLNGKFAKVIMKNEEVIFIESWDLVDGGLITNSDGNTLTYIKDGKTAYLRNLSADKKLVTIIGENGARITEVKAGSLFMYYRRDGYSVIIVSEKKIVDKFNSVSPSSVQVGQVSYKTKTTRFTENGPVKSQNAVYYTEDGKTFSNTDYAKLLNRDVEAFIGPDGFVWLVKALSENSSVKRFYGLVKGVKMDDMDHEFGEIEVIEINDTFTEAIYKVTDKTNYNGLVLSDIATNVKEKSLKGQNIFIFEINASGGVTSISEPAPIHGFKSANIPFAGKFGTVAAVKIGDSGLFWDANQNMLLIYEKNNELCLKWSSWTSLYDNSPSGSLNLYLFGEGREGVPTLVVLAAGDVSLSTLGSDERYGIITNIEDVLDKNGEAAKEITMINKSGNKKYTVKPEWVNHVVDGGDTVTIEKNTIVKIKECLGFGDDEILILNDYIKPLSKDFTEWDVNTGWKFGIAAGADEKRVLVKGFGGLEEGAVTFHITLNFIAMYDADAPVNKFSLASWSDIDEGDLVLYNYLGDGTRGVIIIK